MTNQEILQNLNTHANDLVAAISKLNVYSEDWGSLPVGVKTTIKSSLVTKLNAHVTNIQADIAEINAL